MTSASFCLLSLRCLFSFIFIHSFIFNTYLPLPCFLSHDEVECPENGKFRLVCASCSCLLWRIWISTKIKPSFLCCVSFIRFPAAYQIFTHSIFPFLSIPQLLWWSLVLNLSAVGQSGSFPDEQPLRKLLWWIIFQTLSMDYFSLWFAVASSWHRLFPVLLLLSNSNSHTGSSVEPEHFFPNDKCCPSIRIKDLPSCDIADIYLRNIQVRAFLWVSFMSVWFLQVLKFLNSWMLVTVEHLFSFNFFFIETTWGQCLRLVLCSCQSTQDEPIKWQLSVDFFFWCLPMEREMLDCVAIKPGSNPKVVYIARLNSMQMVEWY